MEEEPLTPRSGEQTPKVTYTVTFEFIDYDLEVIYSEGGVQALANILKTDLGISLRAGIRNEKDRSIVMLELDTVADDQSMAQRTVLQRSAFAVFDWYRGHGIEDPHLLHAGFRTIVGSETGYFEPITDEVYYLFNELSSFSAEIENL